MMTKRPQKYLTNGRPSIHPYAAVRDTLGTRKAYVHRVRTRAAAKRTVEAMRKQFRAEGLQLGREFIRDGVLLWVERARKETA